MPVTPVQAFRLTDEEFEVLRLVENKVDAFLSENYFPGLSVQVNLPKKTVTERILTTIMTRYRQSGWNIHKQEGDDPEMLLLEFSSAADQTTISGE
ncbi:MAG: hypothetical protein QM523_00845 [Candidatus Pacebacteria bacterium]|nr:hypothetical protein [Candidatus Paceibacterota bacterium]